VFSGVVGCYLAWLVLVRTEVALQLLEQVPLVPRLAGEVPWVGPGGIAELPVLEFGESIE